MTAEKIAQIEHRRHADIDDDVDDSADDFRARVSELLINTGARDRDLWESEEVDVDMSVVEFMEVPQPFRNSEWNQRIAAVFAMAQMQAWLEFHALNMIDTAEASGKKLQSIATTLPRAELKELAKGLIKKGGIAAEKAAKRVVTVNA